MGKKIAYFVSPHGFGHAARACSLIEALVRFDQTLEFIIITKVPRWFFEKSLNISFRFYELNTDIGLVQKNPLEEDLPKTIALLDDLYPLDEKRLSDPIHIVKQENCDLVICDIAPMGIKVAQELGLPSVLVENFTWDWIYQGYGDYKEQFSRHISYLENLFNAVDFRIIAEPYCKHTRANIITRPISRNPKCPTQIIRDKLGVDKNQKLVVLTMGGVYERYECLNGLTNHPEVLFLIPGGKDQLEQEGNIIFLPHESEFYHPDIIHASDVVIGKIGYSTLAEVYQAGKPYGYIPRNGFRESKLLKSYIQQHMNGIEISEQEYRSGNWVSCLPQLIHLPQIKREEPTGAKQAANFIFELMS